MDVRGMAGLLAGACLLLAACSSDEGPGERVGGVVPSEPYDPAAETEDGSEEDAADGVDEDPAEGPVEPDDPYAIPDEITLEYLDRVFEALNAVALQAQEEVVSAQLYTAKADRLLRSIYTGFALSDLQRDYEYFIAENGFPSLKGGPLIATTQRVVDVQEE